MAKGVIKGGAGTANMAAVLVARSVGGDVFYGFISAVAFATILAVVAGLTLSGASAVSHDLYATLLKKWQGRQREPNCGCRVPPPCRWA